MLLGRHKNGVSDPAYSEVQFSATTGRAKNTVQLRNLGTNRAPRCCALFAVSLARGVFPRSCSAAAALEVTLGGDAAISIVDEGEDILVEGEAEIRVEGGSSIFRICTQPEPEPEKPAKRRRICQEAGGPILRSIMPKRQCFQLLVTLAQACMECMQRQEALGRGWSLLLLHRTEACALHRGSAAARPRQRRSLFGCRPST